MYKFTRIEFIVREFWILQRMTSGRECVCVKGYTKVLYFWLLCLNKVIEIMFYMYLNRYRCVVPYPPQGEVELELKVGDIVYVHKKREDGWYKGTLQRSGKTGLFPGSFVEKCMDAWILLYDF